MASTSYVDTDYPLHQMCKEDTANRIRDLKLLVNRGADVNLQNPDGLTPLHIACEKRAEKIIYILLLHGAKTDVASNDGNTALHYVVGLSGEECEKSTQRVMQIVKLLVSYGAEENVMNKIGFTPIRLACLKGSSHLFKRLISTFVIEEEELADCYELYASSVYYNSIQNDKAFATVCRVNYVHKQSYRYLANGMKIRHMGNRPLWKFSSQERTEGLLYRVETQTKDELKSLQNHGEGMLIELLLARQRILTDAAYKDHLLPFIFVYIAYLAEQQLDGQVLSLLTYYNRLQLRHLPLSGAVHNFRQCRTLIMSLYRADSNFVCHEFMHTARALVKFLEVSCDNNVHNRNYLFRLLYSSLLHLFYLCLQNPTERDRNKEEVGILLTRFLRATNMFKLLNQTMMETSESREVLQVQCVFCMERYRNTLGGNTLHEAIGHNMKCFPYPGDNDDREQVLALLLQMLCDAGEDVNVRNATGKTPLLSLLYKSATWTTAESRLAVQTLLIEGADPDIRDEDGRSSLHFVTTGYKFATAATHKTYPEVQTVLEMLLKSGVDPNSQDRGGCTPLHILVEPASMLDDRLRSCMTIPLQILGPTTRRTNGPCRGSLSEFVRLIQVYGGLGDVVTNDGKTPLDLCVDPKIRFEMTERGSNTEPGRLKLLNLAARAIRMHKIPYRESLPNSLSRVIELQD